MLSYRSKDPHGSPPRELPEFENLEIRCAWDGDFLTPVNVRISLEVRCVPNTELQLLNTRPPSIFLINTFSDRLAFNSQDSDKERTDGSSQSPLFAFSPLVSEDAKGRRSNGDEETPKDNYKTTTELPLETISHGLTKNNEGTHSSKTTNNGVESTSESAVTPVSSSSLLSDCTICSSPVRSRKRSATDADLPESWSEVGDRKPRTKESYSGTSNKISPVSPIRRKPIQGQEPQSTKLPQLSSPRGKHSQKPSLIPKPTPRSEKIGSEITVDSGLAEGGEKSLCVASTAQTPSSTPSQVPNMGQTGPIECSAPRQPRDPIIQPGLHDPGQVLDVDMNKRGLRSEVDMGSQPSSSTASLDSLLGQDHRESNLTPHLKHPNAEDCEPQIELVDGILVIKNSANIRSAIYKVAITADIFLDENSNGWHDLLVAGLPKLRNSRSGYFLFLIPDDHGLEFRTTHLQRYKIVEDCLCAEFSNAGDLVVPVRKCEKNFFGVIRDFTVDQEIRATVEPPIMGNCLDSKSKILVKYHAICALRLHKRCFAADKCCFFLYLDGGPEGSFRCELGSQKKSLPMIHIEADSNFAAGISRIQVICSPEDLESFCVTWKLAIPCNRALYWLPRIYSVFSGSRERSRDCLRLMLTEKEVNLPGNLAQELSGPGVDVRSSGGVNTPRTCDDNYQKKGDLKVLGQYLPFLWPSYSFGIAISKTSSIPQVRNVARQIREGDNRKLLRRILVGILCITFLSYGMASLEPSRTYINKVCYNLEEVPSLSISQESAEEAGLLQADLGFWGQFSWSAFGAYSSNFCDNNTTSKNLSASPELEDSEPLEDVKLEGQILTSNQGVEKEGMQGVDTTETSANSTTKFGFLTLRDKIDYWLGWRGPTSFET